MILVDTSVWIDLLTGADTIEAATLRRLIDGDGATALTGLTYAEILQGIARPRQRRTTAMRLRAFPILDPRDIDTYERAAELYRRARQRGRTVRSLVDCVIASVAIENHLPVLQRDRDFDALATVSELKIYPAG